MPAFPSRDTPLARRRPRASRSRRAFTLVELLIVIGVIAVLIGILLPVLGRVRTAANSTACAGNHRQLLQAFLAFAADHRGRLPGGYWDANNPDPQLRSWLTNAGQPWTAAPECGSVFKYAGSPSVYRCPSLDVGEPGSGVGSNGRFDYTAIPGFAGAQVARVPTAAEYRHTDGRIDRTLFAPIVIEEDPARDVNRTYLDGAHCNADRIAPTHAGGGHYGSIDGSVHWLRQDPASDARGWFARAPSGRWVGLGNEGQGVPGGWWDSQ